MAVHLAFLRAINVGGRTVAMARLRQLFEELGLSQVATLIASGNVRFADRRSSRTLEALIEAHLERRLGFPVATFLRTPAHIAAIPAQLPRIGHLAGVTTYVGFLRARPGPAAAQALAALASPVDEFHLAGPHLFWCTRTTIGRSSLSGSHLERALGQPTTLRNLTTIRRVTATWCEPG